MRRRITREPKPRQSVEWQGEVERLGWDGMGVGRMDDGRIVLLNSPLALFPGEVVTAIIELHPKHAQGIVTSWAKRDPRRVEAACPYAKDCGGCSLWEAGDQTANLKWQMVEDLLRRQLPDAPPCQWLPAPQDTLRSRIQLHWDGRSLGFHRPLSHEVVPVDSCVMADAAVSSAIPYLRKDLTDGSLPDGSDRWELAAGTPSGEVTATAAGQPGKAWRLSDGAFITTQLPLTHRLGGLLFHQYPEAFFQVCPEWAWQAFGGLFESWNVHGETLYDIYGGGGFFSFMLASRLGNSILVESAAASCRGAEENIAANRDKLPSGGIEIVNRDVASWLPGSLGQPSDVILLDPPRSGLPKQITEKLITAKAGTLILVGCDGMSFCRDVKRLAPAWNLASLTAIDLFPNTPQVEFVGLLNQAAE